jgi:hypothetical protein
MIQPVFPALLLFSDGSIKALNDNNDLHLDEEWDVAHYEKDDLIVDSSLNFIRFAHCCKKGKLTQLINVDRKVFLINDTEISKLEALTRLNNQVFKFTKDESI